MDCRLRRTECADDHVGCRSFQRVLRTTIDASAAIGGWLQGVVAMPFPFIPTALGLCFLVVWVLIGGMILRQGRLEFRQEREAELHLLPAAQKRATNSRQRSWQAAKSRPKMRVRVAS
jgi:hypothetical protein